MRNSSKRRSKGTGKSVLSFFFGMIMGVVLFVSAIAGTLYALVATVRVGDVTDLAGLEEGTIFDADSEINDKTLLEIYKMLAGEDFLNMTLNELAEKYGLTGKLSLADVGWVSLRNCRCLDSESDHQQPVHGACCVDHNHH